MASSATGEASNDASEGKAEVEQQQATTPEKSRTPSDDEDERLMKEVSTKDLQARMDWAEAKYRSAHDTDIEWLHRKAFLAAHVGQYPVNRLLSLAACYANSVVLGCRYPQGVMTELHRVEEDTLQAVDYLLTTRSSSANKHLRGTLSRSLPATQTALQNQQQQRPQWFSDLKTAT